MDMEIMQAKELVVRAGKQLVESGLIARTWGNVSCRVSDTQFVITPSGRAYETLTPEEIVLVNIADLSYDGDVKPSSEKGIHASAYQLRPEVNFVIHTHQVNASIVSPLGFDINNVAPESAAIIGDHVPMAAYGLPGTGKLRKGVIAAIERSDSKAVIMAHHGAVCMGKDYEEAFAVASELEKVCARHIVERYREATGKVIDTFEEIHDYVIETIGKKGRDAAPVTAYESERDGAMCNLTKPGSEEILRVEIATGRIAGDAKSFVPEADLHRAVYAKRDGINYIIHSQQPDIMAASRLGRTMKPLLDDFAQIAGATVRSAVFDPSSTMKTSKKVVKALKGRDAVLLKDNGALCCGPSKSDAQATEMVMDKGCKTMLGAALFDTAKPINAIETRLMRFIYKTKYSKQAEKK